MVKFYWLRDKRTGEYTIASEEERFAHLDMAWSMLGDEQSWGREHVETAFDIRDEIVPPTS